MTVPTLHPAAVVVLAFLLSWGLTALVREYARRRLIDIPNERSSHSIPTPRGGGLAIIIVAELSIAAAALSGLVPPRVATGVGVGTAAVAAIGWLDDHASIRASTRFAVHFGSALLTVTLCGGYPTLALGGAPTQMGLAGTLLASIAISWLVNLYNFMDGIDGIAGGVGFVAGLAGWALLREGSPGLAMVSAAIGGACAGFLVLNWSPARIFMGDVGSGALGFLFGALAVAGDREAGVPATLWVLVLAAFGLDATVTLVRRVIRRERWYEPHRSHAYQRAVQSGLSHRQVASAAIALTILLAAASLAIAESSEYLRAVSGVAVGALLLAYLLVELRYPFSRTARRRTAGPGGISWTLARLYTKLGNYRLLEPVAVRAISPERHAFPRSVTTRTELISKMKVVILAGGLGSRLAEESSLRPKPMVTIGGRPILWHIMNIFAHHGLTEFIVALGYRAEVVKEYFLNFYATNNDLTVDVDTGNVTVHSGKQPNWRVHLVDTGAMSMTGGRIKRVGPWLGDDDTFLCTYGDGVADVDVRALLAFHRAHGKFATVTTVHPPARFGSIVFDGDRVAAFTEKPQTGEGWINGGFFVLHRKVLDYIDGDDTIWERSPLERLAAEGQLMSYRHYGFFQPMDTLRERQLLEQLWESGEAPWKVWR